ARHPPDRRGVAEHRLHARAPHELARKPEPARAAKHIAGAEVNQVAIAAFTVPGECLDQRIGADALGHRAHRTRAAMKGEVVDRRIEELLLPPHQAAGAAQIVGEPGARIDEAVRYRERRLDERRHAVEERLDGKVLEHLLVPVRLQTDELARRLHGSCCLSAASRRPTWTLFSAAAQVRPLATATKSRDSSAYSCTTSSVTPSLAATKPTGPAAVRIASTTGFSSRAPRSLT